MFRQSQLTLDELETLFNKAPNPYILMDRDFTIVGMNEAYLQATMRAREELIGVNMFDAFPSPPDSVHGRMLRDSFARVIETGQVDHLPLIPYPIANAEGAMEERTWSATNTPIAKDGTAAYILQHTVDVTEFQRLKRRAAPDWKIETGILDRAVAVSDINVQLTEERSFLRSLLEQAPSFTAILRGPDHVFDLANAAYRRLVGDGRVLVGKPVAEALPEIPAQGFVDILDKVYASGEPYNANGARVMLSRHGDDVVEEHFLDFIYQPISDKHGHTVGIFVQGHDITDQRRAEDAARASEADFRSLAQTAPNHVWSVDLEGTIQWCNDRVYEYTGLKPGDLPGRQLGSTVHPEDREKLKARWDDARANGTPLEAEIRLRRHDGAYRWYLTRAVASRDAIGEIARWIGTNTDIEEQKKTEQQLEYLAEVLENRVEERTEELERTQEVLRQSQKMEAIGNLAGGIAHDFNNLLQVVTGNLQLLARHVDGNEKAVRQVENALGAAMRGAGLASQLLAFGRRQPLEPRVVNLGKLLRSMDHLLRRSLGEAVEIDTVVAGGLWNTLVDPTNVETALLNLAINARDAMQGSGKLTIEVGNAFLDDAYAAKALEVTAGQYVMLAVTDNGSGISPELLEKVFEPFFTTKPEGKGTGLGLSMVYGFVKQSKGHIKIYSEEGSGTTVRIYLPRSMDAEDVLTAPVPATSGGSETVLVVEDDEAVRETAVALLTDLGYTVLKARDAASGLVIVESGLSIDLLFTDVVMPGPMKSTDLARRAKERMPHIGVLFTSGYTENSIVHDGRLDAGVQFLSKPYTRDQLARKLRQVFDARDEQATTKPASQPAAPAVPAQENEAAARKIIVLLCEDEPIIRLSTAEILEDAGMTVIEAASVGQALAAAGATLPDILVTDVNLPDGSGIALVEQLRQRIGPIPVVFTTGDNRAEGISAVAASQVLLKPYNYTALEQAIKRLCAER